MKAKGPLSAALPTLPSFATSKIPKHPKHPKNPSSNLHDSPAQRHTFDPFLSHTRPEDHGSRIRSRLNLSPQEGGIGESTASMPIHEGSENQVEDKGREFSKRNDQQISFRPLVLFKFQSCRARVLNRGQSGYQGYQGYQGHQGSTRPHVKSTPHSCTTAHRRPYILYIYICMYICIWA